MRTLEPTRPCPNLKAHTDRPGTGKKRIAPDDEQPHTVSTIRIRATSPGMLPTGRNLEERHARTMNPLTTNLRTKHGECKHNTRAKYIENRQPIPREEEKTTHSRQPGTVYKADESNRGKAIDQRTRWHHDRNNSSHYLEPGPQTRTIPVPASNHQPVNHGGKCRGWGPPSSDPTR